MKLNPVYTNFHKRSTKFIEESCSDQEFSDATLATVDGKQVKAHKILLSSGSMFFKNIFRRYPNKNPLIYLKDIQYKYLDLIMKFIYLGQCTLLQKANLAGQNYFITFSTYMKHFWIP